MVDERRWSATTVRVMIVSPLIVTAFVLLGVFLGFYVSDLTGVSKLILAMVLATGGLFVSLPVIVKVINWMVANEAKKPGAATTGG